MKKDIAMQAQNISVICGVIKNNLPQGYYLTKSRHSDCFVYVLTGGARYTFGDRQVDAKPGGILYLAHRSQYEIRVEVPNYTFIFVDFFFENPEQIVFENAFYEHPRVQALDQKFMEMHRLWPTGTLSDKVYCGSVLYLIYSQIIATSVLSYMPSSRKEQLESTARYIYDHFGDSELSVDMLARRTQLSQVHFRRLFKQLYNTNPARFINEVRINQAKQLLTDKSLSVQEISERCGFTNAYYFARVFRSITGISPTAYRATANTYY